MNKLICALATFVVVASGCGSTTIITGTGGTGAGASTGTGAGTTTAISNGCPIEEPKGGSCAGFPSGLRCTWGISPRPECRDEWDCVNGQWAAPGNVCLLPPPADCGTTQPTVGTPCPKNGDVCTYDGDVICVCDPCAGGLCMTPPTKWQCAPAPATSGCPALVPNDGTPCTQNGVSCSYGFPCSGAGTVVDCTGGLWTWNTMIACPG